MEAGLAPRVKSNWTGAVLVCGKCSKKLGGGFGPDGKTSLAKALRKRLGLKLNRKSSVGIVETRCLDLCPKRAVAVVDPARPSRWFVVPEKADLEEVIDALMLRQE